MSISEKTGKGRTKAQGAKQFARRKLTIDRWLAGERQKDIAAALGVSPQTVSLDIQIALDEWRTEHRGSINEHVEFELKRLYTIELLAEEQFEATQDMRCLEVMVKCGAERRKLLGTDAPSRSEIKADVTMQRTFKTKQEMFQEISSGIERFRARMSFNN